MLGAQKKSLEDSHLQGWGGGVDDPVTDPLEPRFQCKPAVYSPKALSSLSLSLAATWFMVRLLARLPSLK